MIYVNQSLLRIELEHRDRFNRCGCYGKYCMKNRTEPTGGWTVTLSPLEQSCCTTMQTGDIDQPGTWKFQAYVDINGAISLRPHQRKNSKSIKRINGKSNSLENGLFTLFNNSNIANIGDATGVRGSSTAGVSISPCTSDPSGLATRQQTGYIRTRLRPQGGGAILVPGLRLATASDNAAAVIWRLHPVE